MGYSAEKRIEEFSIKGLFGYKNIRIEFIDNVLILVGENGLGKSTILKMLYYSLKGEFEKLLDIDFHSMEIKISNETIIVNQKDIIMDDIRKTKNRSVAFKKLNDLRYSMLINKTFLDAHELYKEVENHGNTFDEKRIMIINNINAKLLHFPTYRRVEEDLHKLYRHHTISAIDELKEGSSPLAVK